MGSQLLELSIENFRSFYAKQTIVFSDDGQTMRPITTIYGKNACGKSNVLFALQVIKNMVQFSANADFSLPYDPFRLQVNTKNAPTSFSIKFSCQKKIFIYEFSYNEKQILTENLREKSPNTNKYKNIFIRNNNTLNRGSVNFGFGQSLFQRTRNNTLLATKAQEDNNPYAQIIFATINSYYILDYAHSARIEDRATQILCEHPELKESVVKALRSADVSIQDLIIENNEIPEKILKKILNPSALKIAIQNGQGITIRTKHYLRNGNKIIRDNDGNPIYAGDIISNESMGIRAMFAVIVPILYTIRKRKTLFIDEFGIYLHPKIAESILDIFAASTNNSSHIIVTTQLGTLVKKISKKSILTLCKDEILENTYVYNSNKHRATTSNAIAKEILNSSYKVIEPKITNIYIEH